jgi:hypothetical protein
MNGWIKLPSWCLSFALTGCKSRPTQASAKYQGHFFEGLRHVFYA